MEWYAFKVIEYTEMNNLKVNIDVNKCHRLCKDLLNLFGVASPFFSMKRIKKKTTKPVKKEKNKENHANHLKFTFFKFSQKPSKNLNIKQAEAN